MNESNTSVAFAEGEYLSEQVAQQVLDTLIDDIAGKQSYQDILLDCKAILNRRLTLVGNKILHISNSDGNLTSAHKLMLVRLINLARKGQYTVIIGDEVRYLPYWLRSASEQDVRNHIEYCRVSASRPAKASLLDLVSYHIRMMRHIWSTPV